MPPIIEIRKLGKKYTLQDVQPYLALRDVVSSKIKNIVAKKEKHTNEFWALQDINLSIEKGERVGIIGRNGAGKSTLLKILSKITPPTTGEIKLRGRVASLLEVGTGFHPELTGRENIYLNGSILGLTKKEINQKLDEIIDFSGVEKFIDTPLKHYSSGMQLRLAFSVAAHLEPEILLIDEVLAVGDLEFQKKCIGKIEHVSKNEGRTILFVSHNLNQIRRICNSAVLLEQGWLKSKGDVNNLISQYTEIVFANKTFEYLSANQDKDFYISKVSLKIANEMASRPVKSTEHLFAEITIHAERLISNSLLALRFTNQENIAVYTTTNVDYDLKYPSIPSGKHMFTVRIPVHLFTPGRYSIIVAWNIPNVKELDKVENDLYIEVDDDQYPGNILADGRLGVINKVIPWNKID